MRKLGSAEAKAADANSELTALEDDVVRLNRERRGVQNELVKLVEQLGVHLRQGAVAYGRLQAQTKAQGSGSLRAAPAGSLEIAQREYQAALDTGDLLKTQSHTAEGLDEKLHDRAIRTATLVAVANSFSGEIELAKRELLSSADVATRRELERRRGPRLRALDSEARRIRTVAGAVQRQTGFANPKALETAKARRVKSRADLAVGMGMMAARLKQLQTAQPLPTPNSVSATSGQPTAGSTQETSPSAGSWKLLYCSEEQVGTLPSVKFKPGEESKLLKRLFGKRFLGSSEDCSPKWSPGERTPQQARLAGQFAPALLGALKGAFTRPGATQRLVSFDVGECNAVHSEGNRIRHVILEGDRIAGNITKLSAVRHVAAAEDLNGDGVLEVVLESIHSTEGEDISDATLVSFAGGRLHELQELAEFGNSCAAFPEGTSTSVKVFVRPGPKPEFKTEETTAKCDP